MLKSFVVSLNDRKVKAITCTIHAHDNCCTRMQVNSCTTLTAFQEKLYKNYKSFCNDKGIT